MYSEEELNSLRCAVEMRISEKRFRHTLGVEKMAARLSDFCLPEKKQSLRAAAILHDIAKELSKEEMLDFRKRGRIRLADDLFSAEATFHSFAAVYLIKRDFSKFATKDILSACRNHTVGTPDMSVFEEIIFLSDFIEEGRVYGGSVSLRERLLSSLGNSKRKNIKLLHSAVADAIDFTIKHLEENKKTVSCQTVMTRNTFLNKAGKQ